MAKGLTEKQSKILEFIIDFQQANGFPPTIRELGDAFEIGSLRGVTVHLDALVRKGQMTRDRTSRSIRVTGVDPREAEGTARTANSAVRLPLVRTLHSGGLPGGKIAAEGQIERYVVIPDELAAPATDKGFVIRVGATGVHGEPILPGDLLVCRPQRWASLGELVVTLLHGDMTVGRADAMLANPDTAALTDREVLGRVVGLMRRY